MCVNKPMASVALGLESEEDEEEENGGKSSCDFWNSSASILCMRVCVERGETLFHGYNFCFLQIDFSIVM